jgi:DNA-binding transcriptional regulator YiaG
LTLVIESSTLGAVDGRELKRRRTRLGYSQPQFAAVLGVSEMTVSRWERGVHRIPRAVALLIRQMKKAEQGGRRKPRKR